MAVVRTEPKVTGTLIRTVTGSPEVWTVTGWCKGGVDSETGSDQWLTRWSGGRWEYTAKGNISAGPAVAPDGTPYSKADLDAAAKTAGSKGWNDGLTAAGAAVAAVPRK